MLRVRRYRQTDEGRGPGFWQPSSVLCVLIYRALTALQNDGNQRRVCLFFGARKVSGAPSAFTCNCQSTYRLSKSKEVLHSGAVESERLLFAEIDVRDHRRRGEIKAS